MGVPKFGLMALLLTVVPSGASQLFLGVPQNVTIGPQTKEVLVSDLFFAVAPGTSRITIDLEANDPSHDLDLFVQFGEPISQEGAVVGADFSSASAGSGIEQIVVSAASSPPLQTGVYYLALAVKTLNTKISATLTITAETGAPLTTFLISTFDNLNQEGWRRNFPAAGLPGASAGNFQGVLTVDAGDFLRLVDLDGPSQDFVLAPAKFLGNLEVFRNARFEFDFRHASGMAALFRLELRLLGAGSAYRWLGAVPAANEWIHVVAPLTEGSWTQIAGNASFRDVLRNVQGVELSMDQAPGGETNDLDNFAFLGDPPAPPAGSPDGPTSSLFETALGEWTRNYPAVGIAGSAVGTPDSAIALGRPGQGSEGFLLFGDADGLGQDFAVAPAQYLGDLSRLDRPWIEFDFRQLEGAVPRLPMTLRLIGSSTVFLRTDTIARRGWQHLRVPFDPKYWVRFEGTASFEQVLARVERIEISMDMAPGPELNGLDNFHLRTEFTPPVGRALEVDRGEIGLTGRAGDPAFPPEVVKISATGGQVAWRASVDPAVGWLRLGALSGMTPADLALTIDPSTLPPGTHQAAVVIRADEFGVPGQTIEVSLVLDAGSPQINPNGVVHGAAVGLAVSPGGLATVFGAGFAAASQTADFVAGTTRLPTEVMGVEVLVLDLDGRLIGRAPLLFVGPRQINFQMPFEVGGLAAVQVVVRRSGADSAAETVSIAGTGPGLFALSGNRAAVLNQDFTLNTPAAGAARGSVILAFLTGVGEVSPALATGLAAPASPLRFANAAASATLGGSPARVRAVVLAPGFVGLAQANIEVPAELSPGEHELRVEIGEQRSNGALVTVR